ncbi:MAG: M56 family metallopeptidase [Clostridia bacterium]
MRSMTFYNYILEATLFGSAMVLILCVVRLLLRGRLGNRVIYFAWLLVALRLLLPISLPNPIMDEFRPSYSVDEAARPVADQVRQRVIDAGYRASLAVFGDEGNNDPLSAFATETGYGHTGKWLLIAYGSVALSLAAWLAFRNLRFRKRLWRDRVSPLSEDALAEYQVLCERYNVKPIPVYFVEPLPCSCLVGVLRPFIAVPLCTPAAHMPFVLAHELCHYRAHEGFWGLVRQLCCIVHWFNPIVWLGALLSRNDGELACDDRVTAKLKDLDRLAYADALVCGAQRGGTKHCVLATGATLTGKQLKKRITAIIQCERVKRWSTALGTTVAICVLMFAFATGESEPLPAVKDIPHATWRATLCELPSRESAIAYARRFLESPFTKVDTSHMSFSVALEQGNWRVLASNAGDVRPIVLRFSPQGYILEYDGSRVLDGLVIRDTTYTHRMFTESLSEYLNEFMSTQLPAQGWSGGTITADIRADSVRYINGKQLNDDGELVYSLTVQVEPVVRVLQYQGAAR